MKLTSSSWFCFACDGNCWEISLSLSWPWSLLLYFSPLVQLRREHAGTAWWAAGIQPRLTHHMGKSYSEVSKNKKSRPLLPLRNLTWFYCFSAASYLTCFSRHRNFPLPKCSGTRGPSLLSSVNCFLRQENIWTIHTHSYHNYNLLSITPTEILLPHLP